MQRLQLAEPSYLSSPGMLSDFDIDEYYVNVPTDDGGIIRVREDYFDDYDDDEYYDLMDQLEPFQDKTLSGLFSGIRDRMQERRAVRKEERGDRREDKQSFRLQKQQGRAGIIQGITDTVKDVFGKKDAALTKQFDVGGNVDFGYQDQPRPGITGKQVAIGAAVLVGLGLAYKLMTK